MRHLTRPPHHAALHGNARARAVAALALAVAAALCGHAAAQAATPGVDAPPEPGPPRAVAVPAISESRLPNGLRVVVAPRRDVPLVTATLVVRAGPEADPAGRAGLSAMVATLLTKGATRRGKPVEATELVREAEALGGSLDSGSGWRGSTLGMTVATPKADAALGLLADVLRRPTLAAPELERARAQALDGLRYALSSPDQVAGFVARKAWWGSSAYGSVTTPASLARLTRADVQRFHRSWYRPDLTVLVLAGDITPEAGAAMARRHLGGWRAPAGAPPSVERKPATPIDAPVVFVDMPGAGQSGVRVVAPYVPLGAPERRIAQVTNAVLAGGYSARLNQEVRIKRGLSYGAAGDAESHEVGGSFAAAASTDNPNAAAVLDLLRSEIARVASEPPAPAELAARQATLVGSFGRRLETTGGLAAQVAALVVQERPLDELARYVDEVLAVTPAQVRDFAQRTWVDRPMRGAIAGDWKSAGPGFKDAKVLRVPFEQLDLSEPGLVRR
jgi:zinc protease